MPAVERLLILTSYPCTVQALQPILQADVVRRPAGRGHPCPVNLVEHCCERVQVRDRRQSLACIGQCVKEDLAPLSQPSRTRAGNGTERLNLRLADQSRKRSLRLFGSFSVRLGQRGAPCTLWSL